MAKKELLAAKRVSLNEERQRLESELRALQRAIARVEASIAKNGRGKIVVATVAKLKGVGREVRA